MAKKIPPKPSHVKILWGKSHNLCPICKEIELSETEDGLYTIGVMAHIAGENETAARYRPDMTDDERRSYKNLILVCPNCHTKIDNEIENYSEEGLHQIKDAHEIWAMETLKNKILDVTFAELEVVNRSLISDINALDLTEINFKRIPPNQKINKNDLSDLIRDLIIRGMTQNTLVENFINAFPDPNFSERLRLGFIYKYQELVDEGFHGDALFFAMLEFAGQRKKEYAPAGLAILVYYFILCEVFED